MPVRAESYIQTLEGRVETVEAAVTAIGDTYTESEVDTLLAAKAPATGKLYLKDTQGTPHYWQVTVSVLGVLTTADAGTTLPTDGFVGVPA